MKALSVPPDCLPYPHLGAHEGAMHPKEWIYLSVPSISTVSATFAFIDCLIEFKLLDGRLQNPCLNTNPTSYDTVS